MAAFSAYGATSPGFGEPWVADTSVADTLQTFSVDVPGSFTSLGHFQYEIGFGTSEEPATGSLFDSLTISLAQPDGSQSAIIVTADVFGLTIAPISPGSVLAGGGNILVQPVSPNSTTLRDSPTMFAYSVSVSLPPALAGQDLRSTFSFFNNGDAAPSVGHASVVPEPKASMLALTGCILMAAALLRQKARTV